MSLNDSLYLTCEVNIKDLPHGDETNESNENKKWYEVQYDKVLNTSVYTAITIIRDTDTLDFLRTVQNTDKISKIVVS